MALVNPLQIIPNLSSKPEEWIEYHKAMKKRYGKKDANMLWVKTWGRFGSGQANTNDLRTYMEDEGVRIDKSAWDSIVDTGSGITDFFGDIFSLAKWYGIALAVIILLFLAIALYNIARKPEKIVGALKYAV